MGCLWCDAPTPGDYSLCPNCWAIETGPRFDCPLPGHLPTRGDRCADCERVTRTRERQAARNAPILNHLLAIRAQHLAEWHERWPGMEFAKGHLGMMLNRAILELGGTL